MDAARVLLRLVRGASDPANRNTRTGDSGAGIGLRGVSRKRRRPAGQTLGSIIVGFDQQIFRTLPPAQELVARARPVRGTSGQEPDFEVVFPGDAVVDAVVDAGGASADVGVDVDEGEPADPDA